MARSADDVAVLPRFQRDSSRQINRVEVVVVK
jgi:hypothetical protein